ncbi:MAG: hypothetical protein A2107_15120 [Verrucomicrobia bacterium GWF2_62_7]|nr:MAG: hypothetical protein A2107_15120 [Verrucomicrobia bacterium GWF2_62_7]
MLRRADVFVLEKGAIEQYYPADITGTDKPSKAQDFCRKVTSREAILECCGDQLFERHEMPMREKEFTLIFGDIFGSSQSQDRVNTAGVP